MLNLHRLKLKVDEVKVESLILVLYCFLKADCISARTFQYDGSFIVNDNSQSII